MAAEGVRLASVGQKAETDVVAARPDRVGGVDADVGDEEVEVSVEVVIEEESAGGVTDMLEPRLAGHVAESARAVVLEEDVAETDRGDVEVGVAIVVDVGEAGGGADPIGQSDAGRFGDVLEAAAAQIAPELVAAELADEIEVESAVAVDVGHRDAVAVVVVVRLVALRRVGGDLVLEGDPALRLPVAQRELVKDLELAERAELLLAARGRFGGGVDGLADGNASRRLRAGLTPCGRRNGAQGRQREDGVHPTNSARRHSRLWTCHESPSVSRQGAVAAGPERIVRSLPVAFVASRPWVMQETCRGAGNRYIRRV